jgi:hypothetical protein
MLAAVMTRQLSGEQHGPANASVVGECRTAAGVLVVERKGQGAGSLDRTRQ